LLQLQKQGGRQVPLSASVPIQLNVFFDETEILPGQDFQSRLESGIRESAAIIVLVGPGGLGPWQELENHAQHGRTTFQRLQYSGSWKYYA
jgi:hypothetical protein